MMTDLHQHHPIQASTFARVGVVMYMLLIVYASLYPFSGWIDNGLPPFGYLVGPRPQYWTYFDVVTNIIGYVPFGALVVFALYPRLRGLGAALIAIASGLLLSGTIEAAQNFLPARFPSNIDLLTNFFGACIGAVVAVWLTPKFLERSRFLRYRHKWFLRDAGRGMVVIGLWPLAQIYPQGYLFGNGQFLLILSGWLSELSSSDIDIAAMIRSGAELAPAQYWLAEAVLSACGLTGALLTFLVLLRKNVPSAQLTVLLITAALVVKTLASALFFTPANAFAWLTPGALGGLLFGGAMLFGLAFAPAVAQRRIAMLMLMVSLLVVNLIPVNPYYVVTMQTWVQGRFLNFNGAAQFLSSFWPFLCLWFLLHPAHKQKQK